MDDEPRMIPWRLPELQEARQEILLRMAQLEAGEGPEGRTAFERFIAAALKPVGKRVPDRAARGRRAGGNA